MIEDWAGCAADAGQHFGVGDLLIGAIASEHHGAIWSLDEDFARMANLGFVTLHR